MGDNISFVDNDLINEKLQLVLRQTDYTEEKAIEKLHKFDYNHILVIKDFLGIPLHKDNKIKSVNQEIYRQIRYKLNNSLNEYNKKNPTDMNKVIQNLKISEQNEFDKKNIKN